MNRYFFFFLTLQKRCSERLRNLLKFNSKYTLELDSSKGIQRQLHTEVMASENIGILTALWSLFTS